MRPVIMIVVMLLLTSTFVAAQANKILVCPIFLHGESADKSYTATSSLGILNQKTSEAIYTATTYGNDGRSVALFGESPLGVRPEPDGVQRGAIAKDIDEDELERTLEQLEPHDRLHILDSVVSQRRD